MLTSKPEVTINITHIDSDGFLSAAIIDYAYKHNHPKIKAKPYFIPFLHSYTFDIDKHIQYRDVKQIILTDISLDPTTMKNLVERKFDIIYLDHHQTAIDDSIKNNYDNLPGKRDINKSACLLTWEYFYPDKPIPDIVYYVNLYDLWKREEDKNTDFVESALRSYDIFYKSTIAGDLFKNDSRMLVNLLEGTFPIEKLIEEGKSIERYRRKQWKLLRNKIMYGNIHGLNVLLLNISDGSGSRPFEHIDFPHDAVITFGYKTDGHWAFGIYSKKEEVDVSEIAKLYGGGGHKSASGFVLPSIDEFLNTGNFVSLQSLLRDKYNKSL